MRNAILEYIELSDAEKKELWDNAVFIFDTNVLLNLYRYSSITRDDLFLSFENLQKNIWLPYQVANEFMKRRYEIIWDINNNYDQLIKEANTFTNKCISLLRLDKNPSDFEKLLNYIKNFIESIKT